MINLYSPIEVGLMREGGKILGETLREVLRKAVLGVTTLELDILAERRLVEAGAEPSFKMEKGYHFTTCMNVNDMVVHGIPTGYLLQEGDVLGVDVGAYYKGFHTDASWTVTVGGEQGAGDNRRQEIKKFLEAGEKALESAIGACRVGNHVGDISKAIQDGVEGAGYSSVRQLVGHGVGKKLHEDPEVPCYVRGKTQKTPLLKEGMVLAIEVIYNQGGSQVVYGSDDGWTIVTKDGSLSGLFEQTVALTSAGTEILTKA